MIKYNAPTRPVSYEINERDKELRRMTGDIDANFSTVQNALNELSELLKSLNIEWTPPDLQTDPNAGGGFGVGGGGT